MKLKTYIYVTLTSVVLTGCAGHTHDAQNDAAAAEEIAGTTVFTRAQQEKVAFAVEELRPQAFGPIIRTAAQIQPAPSDERIVNAKMEGTVVFSDDNLVEGRAVAAGQTLFVVDGSDAADNNLAVRYAEAEAEYERTKAEYERRRMLAGDRIVPQSEVLRSRTDFVNAEAAFNNLKRNFPAGKQTVVSPVNGFVARMLVSNGQYAEAGQPVMVVSQNRALYVKAELQAKYFDALSNIESVNIRVSDSDRTYTLEELNGRLVAYGRSTDINHPLAPVTFRISPQAELLPGRFVELFIQTQTNAQALIVPNAAIVEEMGSYFVYVQQSPERFEKRPVEKGATNGLRTEIRQGVAEGETVVSRGALFIKLAQAAGTADLHSGHVH